MEQPDSLILPFGANAEPGTIEPIPNDRAPEDLPERATWNDGFPAVTMTPLSAGGIPPRGQDFNGILNAISEHTVFTNSGGQYRWDADFVAATGGYSKGAVLQSDNGLSAYVSTIDNNTINFNTTPSSIGNQWVPYAGDSIPTQTQAVWNSGTLTTESRISPAKLQAKLTNFAPVQSQSIWNTGTSNAESRLSPLKLHAKLLDFAPAQTQAIWNSGASTIESRISPAKLQAKLNLHAPQLSQTSWNAGVSGVEALISPGKLANRLRYAVNLGTTNLNTLNSPAHIGTYYQTMLANATTARNYPEGSGAGVLEVIHGGAYGGVIQRFTVHLIGSGNPLSTVWIRSNATSGAAWTGWVRLITDKNEASTSSPGIVEKATTAEAQAGTANKYPDAAGVHAAFNQFGLGGMTTPSSGIDFNDFSNRTLYPASGANYLYSTQNENGPTSAGTHVFTMKLDDNYQTQLGIQHSGRTYVRAVSAGDIRGWSEVIRADSLLSGTGQSTEYPMTQKAVTDALNAKVGLSGNQTVAGIKTFSSFPVTPSGAPTANYQAANKKYVDDSVRRVGAAVERSVNTTYTAGTDGMFITSANKGVGTPANRSVEILINGVRRGMWRSSTDSNDDIGCVSILVAQGQTYRAALSANTSDVGTYWIPLS